MKRKKYNMNTDRSKSNISAKIKADFLNVVYFSGSNKAATAPAGS